MTYIRYKPSPGGILSPGGIIHPYAGRDGSIINLPEVGGTPGGGNELISALALLHFDGTDEQTSPITDEVGTMSWASEGGAKLDDSQTKFGPTDLYCDGIDDNVLSTTSVNLNPTGTGGWTQECWAYVHTAVGNGQIRAIWAWDNGGAGYSPLWFRLTEASPGLMRTAHYSSSNGGSWDVFTGGAAGTKVNIAVGEWHHYAASYDPAEDKLYVYIDGVLDQTGTTISATKFNYTLTVSRIGARYTTAQEFFPGHIAEFAVTQACKYPGGTAFTPLTTPYTLP